MRRSLALAALLLPACADREPARVSLAPQPDVVLDEAPQDLRAAAFNAAGERLADAAFEFAAEPVDVAIADAAGGWRCVRSGDAVVTARAADVVASVPVKCRLVEKVEAIAPGPVLLGSAPQRLRVRVLDAAGESLADVPVAFAVADGKILAVQDGVVVPNAVGRTKVTVSAGKASAVAEIEVRRKIEARTLQLADAAAEQFALAKGRYLVHAETRSAAEAGGVALAFTGADCPALPESARHDVACAVAESATLEVSNPPGGAPDPLAGLVEIFEVP